MAEGGEPQERLLHVRIASYNVRDLFDEAAAALAGGAVKTSRELKALAGTIGAVAADVILLQEVGSKALLDDLNTALVSPYPFADLLKGNSSRGIHLAILSRRPFELTSHRSLELRTDTGTPLMEYDTEADALAGNATPARMQRDLMLAEVQLPDEGVLPLFNVHLKSRTNRSWRLLAADVIRAAEVRQVIDRVGAYMDAHPDRPVVLGGDFNDRRSSVVLEPLSGLSLSDPMGEALAASGRNPSTYWPKRRMRLDFLLLSPAARSRLVPDSPIIHSSERARRASDHYPVSLDLAFPDKC